MKRVLGTVIASLLMAGLFACAARTAVPVSAESTPFSVQETAEPAPTAPPASEELGLPAPPEGWAESYLEYMSDNYDIFAALWPEGLTGAGFIDLDLDGTPELVVFDSGASATMGVHLFDLVDGHVYCVSSALDSAAGAFGDAHFSHVSICASYFEAFRLSRTEEGWCFWVDSANGTMEISWDDIIRFDNVEGVLTPAVAASRYLRSDIDTGVVTEASYTVDGDETDAAGYGAVAAYYAAAPDAGYDAAGVFLWNDMSRYDTSYDGFMALAQDAAAVYRPIG